MQNFKYSFGEIGVNASPFPPPFCFRNSSMGWGTHSMGWGTSDLTGSSIVNQVNQALLMLTQSKSLCTYISKSLADLECSAFLFLLLLNFKNC
jgi:hypothetical protein